MRDNVYCATALWSLSLAYRYSHSRVEVPPPLTNVQLAARRHVGCDMGRTCELEQGAVKCMRGILFCYMRQAAKVRREVGTEGIGVEFMYFPVPSRRFGLRELLDLLLGIYSNYELLLSCLYILQFSFFFVVG